MMPIVFFVFQFLVVGVKQFRAFIRFKGAIGCCCLVRFQVFKNHQHSVSILFKFVHPRLLLYYIAGLFLPTFTLRSFSHFLFCVVAVFTV